jgi:hypothetical protein
MKSISSIATLAKAAIQADQELGKGLQRQRPQSLTREVVLSPCATFYI